MDQTELPLKYPIDMNEGATPKQIRQNPSGSLKLRVGIDRGPSMCQKYVSFGLGTQNPEEALDKANFLIRCLRLAGAMRGEAIRYMGDDVATQQLNKLEQETLNQAAELNRLKLENSQLKSELKSAKRIIEVSGKKSA